MSLAYHHTANYCHTEEWKLSLLTALHQPLESYNNIFAVNAFNSSHQKSVIATLS